LAQRASGLRAVQALWREYRDQFRGLWGEPAQPHPPFRYPDPVSRPGNAGWSALDFLARRYPEDQDKVEGTVSGTVHADTRMVWDGHISTPWWHLSDTPDADLLEIMTRCKARVAEELDRIIPNREPKAQLYGLMREYPAREGKGLRPTLTIATCVAFGGQSIEAIRTAAAIELFHNAFLVHDDIADESTHRRGGLTLYSEHGLGLAVNTGDAMNLLAIDAILSNLEFLGLARTLGLIHEVIHMCRESLEGQAIELGWIRQGSVPPEDEDYFLMSTKKTGWYTCISPCRMGAVCAGETDPTVLDRFNEVFRLIGVAFQIQDDVLNLVGETALYGKEPLGDLLECKRTVMLIHLFRTADPKTRKRLYELIRTPRAGKVQSDAEEILAEMQRFGSIEYAIALADRIAHQGARRFEEDLAFLPETEAKGVLRQIANYVTTRPL
jgi:geranylgeranyl diphosphate synthase type II